MIEDLFDIPFIAQLALRAKQIHQNYRPVIAVHKWFARRPGTLFRGLLLAEFGESPVAESFFRKHDFPGRAVADPFMGGGSPLLEANRVGCDVIGFDINPMSAWIVREEIRQLDQTAYRAAAAGLLEQLSRQVGDLYRTDCPVFGDRDVPVKYFLWVKVLNCVSCGRDFDLFPGYLLAENRRHPRNVLVCPGCGELNEVADLRRLGSCHACDEPLLLSGPAGRNQCRCPHCGHLNRYPRPEAGAARHRLFAIEYHNPPRKNRHEGRFFKRPDAADLERFEGARRRWLALEPRFTPTQVIPSGDETDRLKRWGYTRYRELFHERQLLGLELSARHIAAVPDERVRHALATNLSDLVRYQNLLCRYDTMALKSLDVFSIHGFPVGLIQCESNLLGIANGNGSCVGSGGWRNIIEKYAKAKEYCEAPFEVHSDGSRRVVVPVAGEWIGEQREGTSARRVELRYADSSTAALPPGSLDAVFTDPPYFGNVQYGELMDFCYVWLRNLVGSQAEGFDRDSTRAADELTVNSRQGRDLEHFTSGLSAVFHRMADALKEGAPLVFTYHHNRFEAYQAVGVAILDSGLWCTAALPCPAEMGGSIHIHGTGSSIVDTVFVCRRPAGDPLLTDEHRLFAALLRDVEQLRATGMRPTAGDIRCLVFGHLTRQAILSLRRSWNPAAATDEKLRRFADAARAFGEPQSLIDRLVRASTDAGRETTDEPPEQLSHAVPL